MANLYSKLAKVDRLTPGDTTDTAKRPKRKRRRRRRKAKPNPNAPLGQGGRFAALVAQGKSPALAAAIGRKKYGAKKFASLGR